MRGGVRLYHRRAWIPNLCIGSYYSEIERILAKKCKGKRLIWARLAPYGGKELFGETTAYRATLERGRRKIEIPIWGDEMPSETAILFTAAQTARTKIDFGQYCKDNKLDPADRSSKRTFQRTKEFEREIRRFFTHSEVERLKKLNAPVQVTPNVGLENRSRAPLKELL